MSSWFGFRHLHFGLLILFGVLSWSAQGQENYAGEAGFYPWELNLISDGLEKVSASGTSLPCNPNLSPQPSCSKLADRFCAQLWSPKNKGNLDTPSGRFQYGKSQKSNLSHAKKTDLEALVDSLPRLSEGLRSKVEPAISKLKNLLSQEQDSESWYEAIDKAENEFWEMAKQVSNERVLQKYPELKALEQSKLTVEQQAAFVTSYWDLKNEITAAKYQNHPNWLRVVRMYEQAKADLLTEIPKWNLPSAVKEKFLIKVSQVELKLPSADPRVVDYQSELANCATTDNNAYYSTRHRVLSVCAGEFNSEQSDASIYATIAHEIGHSIDTDAVASDAFMESPMGKVVARLCNARGPVFSCSEWNRLKQSVLLEPPSIPLRPSPLRKLSSCLVSEAGLKPFKDHALRKAAREEVANEMESVISIKEPQDFLRPDRLRAKAEGYVFIQRFCEADTPIYNEIISQELSCRRSLKKAIQTATDIGVAQTESKFSFCGRDCMDDSNLKMFRGTTEETADWVAKKLTTVFIKRTGSQALRREELLASSAALCINPDEKQDEDDHPPDRSRISSMFSPEIRQLVGCESDEEVEKSRAKCDL